jgi:hypothetical protein
MRWESGRIDTHMAPIAPTEVERCQGKVTWMRSNSARGSMAIINHEIRISILMANVHFTTGAQTQSRPQTTSILFRNSILPSEQ